MARDDGRGALVPVTTHPEEDEAARAFRTLRAEVTILREDIDDLKRAVMAARPVDLTPSLEKVVEHLARVEARLTRIENQPALAQTAEVQRSGLERAVRASFEAPKAELKGAADELRREKDDLVSLARSNGDATRRVHLLMLVAGALALMLVSVAGTAWAMSGLVREGIAVGDRAALRALDETDQWRAGEGLMQRANPEAYRQLMAAKQFHAASGPTMAVLGPVVARCRDVAGIVNTWVDCPVQVSPTGLVQAEPGRAPTARPDRGGRPEPYGGFYSRPR